jgi:hypothetical protein
MKRLLTLLIGLIVALFSLTVSVEAYGIYGYGSYPNTGYGYGYYSYPHPYYESSDFYKYFNGNQNSNSYSALNQGAFSSSGSQIDELEELGLSFGSSGYGQNSLQNVFQNMNTNDGYSFTKGPCVTEKIKGNFKGKDNDFTLTKEVCDNIEGNFYKDNSYSLGNSGQYFNGAYGVNGYQNQLNKQKSNSNIYNNQQSYDVSQDMQHQDLTVSFGKGTKIVLN